MFGPRQTFFALSVLFPCLPVLAQPALLGADASAANLLRIDPATGATSIIGPLNLQTVGSLAFDSRRGILYGTTTHSPQLSDLVRIDPTTGAGAVIGPLGVVLMHGLEYNAINDTLYGSGGSSGTNLYRIDTATGAATLIAPLSVNGMVGIAFDPVRGVMYAAHVPAQNLYTLNLSNGNLTFVGPFGAPGQPIPQVGVAMAFDPALGLLAIDNTGLPGNSSLLYSIDSVNGHATLVGPTIVANILGLAFVANTCYPDCDQSTGPGNLDIFDFLCFQDAFITNDPYADCDNNSIFDVFDFLCFQDAFTNGCP